MMRHSLSIFAALLLASPGIAAPKSAWLSMIAADVPRRDLAAFWRFTDGAKDFSGNGRNGTLFAGTGAIADGCFSNATSTGGISVADFDYSTTTFSAFCWIRTGAAAGTTMSYLNHSAGASRAFQFRSVPTTWNREGTPDGNEFGILLSQDGGDGNAKLYWVDVNVQDGAWHHIGWTFATNNLRLYLDGTAQTIIIHQQAEISSFHNSTSVFSIGANASGANSIIGCISRAALYNRELTENEVLDIYLQGPQ